MSTHVLRWLEAAARHLVEEAIVGGCRDVVAHFEGGETTVVIVVERTPVRVPRGHLSLIGDGVWVHTDDLYGTSCGESAEFEIAGEYPNRAALVMPLALFLQQRLGEQSVIDLHMEGSDGERNICFETNVYSDDGVSFRTGAVVACGVEEASA